MNKKLYLLPLLLLAFVFTSCEETKEASKFDNWRPRNEAFIDSLQQVYANGSDPTLKYIVPLTDPKAKIFYKDMTPAGKVLGATPQYSDSVQVYYRSSYIFNESFEQNFMGKEPNVEFDIPLDCYVNPYVERSQYWPIVNVISGWSEVLQRMQIGQRWVIYIPWQYGYGSSGGTTHFSKSVLGYSTLICDLQLESIIE